jgi:hypothetical protein
MSNYKVSNVRIEEIYEDFSMVFFDVTSSKGTVELTEHFKIDEDDDQYIVSRIDSNIKIHKLSELRSIVEDDDDYVFVLKDIIDEVEEQLNESK